MLEKHLECHVDRLGDWLKEEDGGERGVKGTSWGRQLKQIIAVETFRKHAKHLLGGVTILVTGDTDKSFTVLEHPLGLFKDKLNLYEKTHVQPHLGKSQNFFPLPKNASFSSLPYINSLPVFVSCFLQQATFTRLG